MNHKFILIINGIIMIVLIIQIVISIQQSSVLNFLYKKISCLEQDRIYIGANLCAERELLK